ncbi:MAG: hypothetical protein ACRD3E_12340 [Terriglobales bacterium]
MNANSGAASAGHRLALVGSYAQREGLDRAAEEFAAAAFGHDDAVFVRATRPAESGLWSKLWGWGRARVTRDAQVETLGPDISLDTNPGDDLLNAGGGFVLVRCAARFHQACEIIERTGGRVGCIATANH